MAGEDYIVALIDDPQTPPTVLERGLRMLRPDHPSLSIDRLRRFLARPEEALRIEAVRSLSQGNLPGRFELLAKLAEDRSASVPLPRRRSPAWLTTRTASESGCWLWRRTSSRYCGAKRSAGCADRAAGAGTLAPAPSQPR